MVKRRVKSKKVKIVNGKRFFLFVLTCIATLFLLVGLVVKFINRDKYFVSNYSRELGETSDYNRIQSIINEMKDGTTLIFDEEEYDLAGKDLVVNKEISIRGKKVSYDKTTKEKKGTILLNGGIVIKASNVKINNIFVYAPELDNGFEANKTAVSNINISNCIALVRDHGYLFESYNGLVENVVVEKSKAYDSIHGFISKARNVKFNKCFAYNNKQNGFGFVSDNIPGEEFVGEALDNTIQDCYIENAYTGITIYSRDYYSENNINDIELKGIRINNNEIYNCITGIQIGDGSKAPSGRTYNQVLDINCKKNVIMKENRGVYSFDIGLARDINITEGETDLYMFLHLNTYENVIVNNSKK